MIANLAGSPLLVIGVPLSSLTIAATGLILGFLPQIRERQERKKEEEAEQDRLNMSADYVLGREADLSKGQLAIRGLVERMEELDRKLEKE